MTQDSVSLLQVLLDGGQELGTGFTELAVLLKQESSEQPTGDSTHSGSGTIDTSAELGGVSTCTIGADTLGLRVWGSAAGSSARGYLRTSEVVASFVAGPPPTAGV